MKISDDIYFVEYDIINESMICHFKNLDKTTTVKCTPKEYIDFDKQLNHKYTEEDDGTRYQE